MQNRIRILELLSEANLMFQAIGEEPLWCTRWNTGKQVSQFLEHCIAAIRRDELSVQDFQELWCIFAPTCTWDDNGGGLVLGHEVYELLERQRSDFGGTYGWKDDRTPESDAI